MPRLAEGSARTRFRDKAAQSPSPWRPRWKAGHGKMHHQVPGLTLEKPAASSQGTPAAAAGGGLAPRHAFQLKKPLRRAGLKPLDYAPNFIDVTVQNKPLELRVTPQVFLRPDPACSVDTARRRP